MYNTPELRYEGQGAFSVLSEIVGLKEEPTEYLRKKTDDSIRNLCRLGYYDLITIKGIGPVMATKILKAVEFSKRVQMDRKFGEKQIKSSHDGFALLQPIMGDLPHEEMWMIILNRSNKIMSTYQVSKGGVAGTVADVKIIFKAAIDRLASAIIIAHNHPSGSLRPSEADKALTKKVYKAGKVMDISVLDHLIVTDNGYFSFADEGMMG